MLIRKRKKKNVRVVTAIKIYKRAIKMYRELEEGETHTTTFDCVFAVIRDLGLKKYPQANIVKIHDLMLLDPIDFRKRISSSFREGKTFTVKHIADIPEKPVPIKVPTNIKIKIHTR